MAEVLSEQLHSGDRRGYVQEISGGDAVDFVAQSIMVRRQYGPPPYVRGSHGLRYGDQWHAGMWAAVYRLVHATFLPTYLPTYLQLGHPIGHVIVYEYYVQLGYRCSACHHISQAGGGVRVTAMSFT